MSVFYDSNNRVPVYRVYRQRTGAGTAAAAGVSHLVYTPLTIDHWSCHMDPWARGTMNTVTFYAINSTMRAASKAYPLSASVCDVVVVLINTSHGGGGAV